MLSSQERMRASLCPGCCPGSILIFPSGSFKGPQRNTMPMQGNRIRVAAGFDKNDNMGETREYGPW